MQCRRAVFERGWELESFDFRFETLLRDREGGVVRDVTYSVELCRCARARAVLGITIEQFDTHPRTVLLVDGCGPSCPSFATGVPVAALLRWLQETFRDYYASFSLRLCIYSLVVKWLKTWTGLEKVFRMFLDMVPDREAEHIELEPCSLQDRAYVAGAAECSYFTAYFRIYLDRTCAEAGKVEPTGGLEITIVTSTLHPIGETAAKVLDYLRAVVSALRSAYKLVLSRVKIDEQKFTTTDSKTSTETSS